LAPPECRTASRLAPAPATVPGVLPRILLPNLTAMLTVATLAYCLFVFGATQQLFRDSDTGWHIRTGEWILDHHALPRSDLYSFSRAGRPWVAWEWGSDVLMGLAHRIGGLRAVAAFFSLAIAATTWLCCRLHFTAGGDFFLTALSMPLVITTTSLHWLARPHVFSWLFLLGALIYVIRLSLKPSLLDLAGVAAVTAVWANVHASFFLAPVIALIFAASHLLRPWLWPLDGYVERYKARWFLSIASASAAGSFLNPYGWGLHVHVLSYLRDDALTSRIAEFQSFNFHTPGAAQVVTTVLVAMAGALLALQQKQLAQSLGVTLLVVGALRYARLLPILALLALPLANAAITEALRNVRGLQPALQRAVDAVTDYSRRLRRIDLQLAGSAFSIIAVSVLPLSLYRLPGAGFPSGMFPVDAARAVKQLPGEARLLAPDSYGGYLIYRFSGQRKVFFDGRSDFYGADFMQQYAALMSARAGWQEIVRSFRFTHALLPNESPLNAALRQAGWRILYKDRLAALLEQP